MTVLALGSLLIGTGLLCLFFYGLAYDQLIFLFEKFISPDQSISGSTKWRLKLFIYYLAILLLTFGVAFLGCTNDSFRNRVKSAFFSNKAAVSKIWILRPLNLLLFSFLSGLLLTGLFTLFYSGNFSALDFLFVEDGVFETLSAITFGVSALLMLKSAQSLKTIQAKLSEANRRLAFLFYLLLAFIFFFVAMEEISWGQRIIGWETPDYLSDMNEQKETSIHNIYFLDGLFDFLYLVPAFLIIPVVLSAWLRVRNRQTLSSRLFLPEPSLIFLTILIGIASFTVQGELLEELLSLFAVLYCIGIVYYLTTPSRQPSNKSSELS